MRKNWLFFGFLLGILLFIGQDVWAKKYMIDPVHSAVSFKVKHLVISKVQGNFEKFSGEFFYNEKDSSTWSASASIEAKSIDTDNDGRDKHLRAADFFDVEKHPNITFQSTKVTDLHGNKGKLHGNLTMRGNTKPVILDLEIGGTVKDPWGSERAGFEATTKINRKDFGVAFHKVMETGGLMVDDMVEITLNIEGVAKKEEQNEAKPSQKK